MSCRFSAILTDEVSAFISALSSGVSGIAMFGGLISQSRRGPGTEQSQKSLPNLPQTNSLATAGVIGPGAGSGPLLASAVVTRSKRARRRRRLLILIAVALAQERPAAFPALSVPVR